MLKRQLTLLFSLVLGHCYAQLVFTHKHYPPNGSYTYGRVTDTAILNNLVFDTTSAKPIWDFRNLTFSKIDTNFYLDAKDDEHGSVFIPPATHCNKWSDTAYFINKRYYLLDSSGYFQVGSKELSGWDDFELDKPFSKFVPVYRFPLKLGDYHMDSVELKSKINVLIDTTLDYTDSSYWLDLGNFTSSVLSEGMLITESSQTDAILIKYEATSTAYKFYKHNNESWRIIGTAVGGSINYQWLAKANLLPVISVSNHFRLANNRIYTQSIHVLTSPLPHTAISEFVNQKVSVYPNPAANSISVSANVVIQTISISDIQGRVQKTTTHDIHNMNIEHLPQGMYILQAHREDGRIYTTKFVKE